MYLHDVYSYLPEKTTSLDLLAEPLKLKRAEVKLFQRYHGIHSVSDASDLSLKEILAKSLVGILERNPSGRDDIKDIIYCHTILNNVPFPSRILEELKREMGLTKASLFSLTMAHCASGLVALDVARKLLRSSGGKALILTGDKCFGRMVQVIDGASVLGDASTATLLSREGDDHELLSLVTTTLGEYSLMCRRYTKSTLHGFQEGYLQHLLEIIRRSAKKHGMEPRAIPMILPHNVNRSSWKDACQRLEIPLENIFLENVTMRGHCFGSDPYLNWTGAIAQKRLKKGDLYLMVSAGLGATLAAAMFRY